MKNTLSKTLLCGVLATTFFLINCQKAPNRGVKAKTGTPGAGAQGKTDVAVAPKETVACPADFAAKYKESSELIKSIVKLSSENLDETMKESLNKKIDEAKAKTEVIVASIKKVKETADSCSLTDPSTKKTAVFTLAGIQKELDDAAVLVKTKTGRDSTASKEAEKRKKDQELFANKNGLKQNLILIVSEEMAKSLVTSNKGDVIVASEGKIEKFTEDIEKLRKERTKTICNLADIPELEKEVKAGDKLKVTSYQLKDAKLKDKAEYVLDAAGALIRIECSLAKGKETTFATEFRKAFGEHLVSEAQVKELEAKKEEDKKKADASEAEKKRQAAVDAAQKVADEKRTASAAADKKLEDAKSALAKLNTDLDKAKKDKKDAEIKDLTAKVEAKKKEIVTLEAEAKAAEEARVKANKDLEAALGKTEV